jgi:alpha-tubulin suppressor-like RCC1 family protein
MYPDDIFNIIIDDLDFYDLLSMCQVPKQLYTLCNANAYFSNIKRKIAHQPIAIDDHNTYYIKNNILYGLGSNRFGQLGINKEIGNKGRYQSNVPIKINI